MITLLLGATSTPGELGMLAAHEGGNWQTWLGAPLVAKIAGVLAACGPSDSAPPRCYTDAPTQGLYRVMPHTASLHSDGNTQESCAEACASANFSYAGVEFGAACFCAPDSWPAAAAAYEVDVARCSAIPCIGNTSEPCGGADLLLAFRVKCTTSPAALLAELTPDATYRGAPRLYRGAVRTAVARAEGNFRMQATVLSASPPSSVLLVGGCVDGDGWAFDGGSGDGGFRAQMVRAGGQVYSAAVTIPGGCDEFSYYVEAEWDKSGATLRSPVEENQTVVVL